MYFIIYIYDVKNIVIGVNHDSAPVDVRERVAFAPEVVPEAISDLISSTQLGEGVISVPATEPKSMVVYRKISRARVMMLCSGWQIPWIVPKDSYLHVSSHGFLR